MNQEAISAIEKLTAKQKMVCCLVATGMQEKEIAGVMQRSVMTTRAHKYAAYKKLGVTNAVQVGVMFALAGIVTDWRLPA